MSDFSAVELIIAKREKQELSTEAIQWLISNYTSGAVADEQMSAMAMAILLNGMNRREIKDLTLAMIATGETFIQVVQGRGSPSVNSAAPATPPTRSAAH